VARPPLRPAAFFSAVVPPCEVLWWRTPEPDAFPPRLEAPGELAIFAARSFDIPFSFSFWYCFSFLTLGRLPGMRSSLAVDDASEGTTTLSGISIRLLAPGDEEVVRELATYDPGIGSAMLARLAELARERAPRLGFVLTDEDNVAANELYRSDGGASTADVMWTFSYGDD